MRKRFVLLLAAFVALMATPAALAQTTEAPSAKRGASASEQHNGDDEGSQQQAMLLKEQGDSAMRSLDYAGALSKYTKSYELDPKPALLYNRGRALQALSRFPEALDEMMAFEQQAPAKLKKRVPKLRELITELRSKVARLDVKCNVAKARVLLDGKLVGTTPFAKPIRHNAGQVSVEIRAEGYHPHTQQLALGGTETHTLTISLRSRATTAILSVKSPVAGAVVFVDGKRIGTVPAETIVDAGTRQVVVEHASHETSETTVVVNAGKRKELTIVLERSASIVQRWWFWTSIGAVVVAGVAVTAIVLSEGPADQGDIPPGQVSAPLLGQISAPLLSF